MSLRPQPPAGVPAETATIARESFPTGHPYFTLRDTFGALFTDADFVDLYAHQGPEGIAPAQLVLITILQQIESLSDREAADAVRGRLEWKYLLGVPVRYAGFDASVLSEFRARLLEHGAEERLLTHLLARFDAHGLLDARSRQRTDSTHVVANVRDLNRLALVRETMRHALEALAMVAPAWLVAHADPAWRERYAAHFGNRLPTSETKRLALAERIGWDGWQLLQALDDATAPAYLCQIEPVVVLRRIWAQQYDQGGAGPRWRTSSALPAEAEQLCSPHDPDARYSIKRELGWTGYKKHLTESCSRQHPRLITEVTTTHATTPDQQVTAGIQDRLVEQERAPRQQVVDGGYVTTALLMRSQERGIDLVGPIQQDTSRQARAAAGYEQSRFTLDWERQRATCPEGKQSVRWQETTRQDKTRIQVHFAAADCGVCPVKGHCTQAIRRSLTLPLRAEYEALQAARERMQTEGFREVYRDRAGIEGTLSQAIRRCGDRRTRYWGLPKVHLGHVLSACGLNLVRVAAWIDGKRPATTRHSHFGALMAATACP